MDIGSPTMYSLHLGTCSFTGVQVCPQEGHHRGQDLGVDCHIYVAVATTIPVEEPGSTLIS